MKKYFKNQIYLYKIENLIQSGAHSHPGVSRMGLL